VKIFYDCEIVERGRGVPMELVSLGIVREDGAEMYVINAECLPSVMRNPWLSTTAVPHLPIRSDDTFIFEWDKNHPQHQNVLNMDLLTPEVLKFITDVDKPDLWAYYSAYKHVVLSQLFGSMAERPARMPMFTHELQQLVEDHPMLALPTAPENSYHAMDNARWVRDAYVALTEPRRQIASGHPYTPAHGVLVNEPAKAKATVLGWGAVYDAHIVEEEDSK
jgi:hypothetical protein